MANKHDMCVQLFNNLCHDDKLPTLQQFTQQATRQIGMTFIGAAAHFVAIVQRHTGIINVEHFMMLSCFDQCSYPDRVWIKAHFKQIRPQPKLVLVDK